MDFKAKSKEVVSMVKNNPIGLLVGAAAGYGIAKKLIKTEKTWVLVTTVVVTALVGSMVQSKMKAKSSQPTAATVSAPVKK